MNGIEQLAESIKKIGLLQPKVVRINSLGSFEVVAGNRRFNACKKLRWRKISCLIENHFTVIIIYVIAG
ncbi:MAG TPA: ParB N-terminal domain-containing protein [Nitrososphaeraceae archaeon]|nr:ParB N-terminal domain-containing protein [Nitrososphaeraceae archaeon]